MRRLLAFVAFILPLAACAQDQEPAPSDSQTTSSEEPAPGPLYSITAVEASLLGTSPQKLSLRIKAVAPTPGYSNFTAEPILTFAPSPDGAYDSVLFGTPPAGMVAMVLTDVEFEVVLEISELPNILRLHAEQNCIALLLAQPEPAPDIKDCAVVRPAGFPPATQG